MNITFTDEGWDDYTHWSVTDRKKLKRINDLIEDCKRDPYSGIGKPEPLKYAMQGYWSRRIDEEHRLVYEVADGSLVIIAARYHY
ncbi:Txe/YoeB family addiction module toxin [Rhodococcus olei]|uniref:Endoribonuclease YoeB n=1 Tax=Rhodococcus olei TaxID=2161675 RepID=A0ABP8NVX4_9NOCA